MTRVPRILMLVENGAVPKDSRVWPEACALRDAGFQVSVICPLELPKYPERYICLEGIHIYRYRLPETKNPYITYTLEYSVCLLMTFWLSLKVLSRHGFDIIHAANPPDLFFLLGAFYRLLGKKFIFDQHDLTPELFLVKSGGRMKLVYRLLLLFERWTYQTAHLVITTNMSQKTKAIERGHCVPDKVYVVRNGPDVTRLRPVEPEPRLKAGRRYVLAYVGVMAAQDGVENALYALQELVHGRGRRDITMVLMGEGEALPVLRTLARELALDEYVNFTGWLEHPDMLRYLSVANVGLTPDPLNGLNEYSTMVKVLIYMALGLPVVAFDLAETRVSAQDAALYAQPNNVADFADKIAFLLDHEECCKTMSACGRKRIEEELSWEYSKKQLLFAYESMFPQDLAHAVYLNARQ